ncbi:MAG: hypothetical protein JHC26_07445 [Thermofilum sp.]|jgi:hypothetical protein|uniref:hypothetical protein n=1 Tax=Thermofilum sp. TaxID=1961369 RepID=UPI00258EE4BF|nr:hypothetical protein [Thermofilum sp.]MCI4408911.1 hypothetical protein [Thermofilum sp.]
MSAQPPNDIIADILTNVDKIEDPLVKEKVLKHLKVLLTQRPIDTTGLALNKALAPKLLSILDAYGRTLMEAIYAAEKEDRLKLKKAVMNLGTYLIELQIISQTPQAALQVKAGPLAGVESTELLLKCGTVSTLLYHYILANGRVSRPELMSYYSGMNISDEDANDAIKCLLENGMIRAEYTGGEIYYMANMGE